MGIAGRSSGVLCLLLLTALPPSVVSQEPSLDIVLARAATYVADLHEQLSGIVAEERYVQQLRSSGRSGPVSPARSQTLKSDFLLVRPEKADRYVEFRDVFEVNGTAVRDRAERLSRLFLSPSAASSRQIKTIIDESARYNIGRTLRNINTPMLPLYFLQRAQQPRFKFKRARSGAPDLTSATLQGQSDTATFRVSTEMWIIEFKETQRGTIIHTTEGRDFPAEGRFWIDPASGAVLMSELVMNGEDVHAVINVSYQSEPLLGFQVPAEMRERYVSSAERVDGSATYGRFRQFQVHTGEDIGVPSVPSSVAPSPPPVTPKKPPAKPPGRRHRHDTPASAAVQ